MRGWGLGIFIRIGFGRSIRADRGCKRDGEACRGSEGGCGYGTDDVLVERAEDPPASVT